MFANTYPKLSEVDLDAVEQRLGVALPDDLRDIYLQFNGGRPLRNVFRSASEEYDIQQFLAMKYADVISLKETVDYVRGLPDNLYAPAL